jgi:hypothetical protein
MLPLAFFLTAGPVGRSVTLPQFFVSLSPFKLHFGNHKTFDGTLASIKKSKNVNGIGKPNSTDQQHNH